MGFHRYGAERADFDRSVTKRFYGYVLAAQNYIAAGDAETALFYLRLAAEAWGRFAERVETYDLDSNDYNFLSAQKESSGERLLSLEDAFTERFLTKPERRGWWARWFQGRENV